MRCRDERPIQSTSSPPQRAERKEQRRIERGLKTLAGGDSGADLVDCLVDQIEGVGAVATLVVGRLGEVPLRIPEIVEGISHKGLIGLGLACGTEDGA